MAYFTFHFSSIDRQILLRKYTEVKCTFLKCKGHVEMNRKVMLFKRANSSILT